MHCRICGQVCATDLREVKSQPLLEPFTENLPLPIQSGLNRLRSRINYRCRHGHAAFLPFAKHNCFSQIFGQAIHRAAHGGGPLGAHISWHLGR